MSKLKWFFKAFLNSSLMMIFADKHPYFVYGME